MSAVPKKAINTLQVVYNVPLSTNSVDVYGVPENSMTVFDTPVWYETILHH